MKKKLPRSYWWQHEHYCAVCAIYYDPKNTKLKARLDPWCYVYEVDFECVAEQLLAEEITK